MEKDVIISLLILLRPENFQHLTERRYNLFKGPVFIACSREQQILQEICLQKSYSNKNELSTLKNSLEAPIESTEYRF